MLSGTENVTFTNIPGFQGYGVRSDGTVWSCRIAKRGRPGAIGNHWQQLKPHIDRGYAQVALRRNGKLRSYRVHRLVLEAFVGPCPDGQECRHKNGVSTDNRLENLCWGTPKDNRADARRQGRLSCGERHPIAKLTDESVREIRRRGAGGETQVSLAAAFGVHRGTIARILHGQGWRHVA